MTLDCWQRASPGPGSHGNHSYSSPTKGGFFGLLSNNRMQNARSKRSRGKVAPLEIAALSRNLQGSKIISDSHVCKCISTRAAY